MKRYAPLAIVLLTFMVLKCALSSLQTFVPSLALTPTPAIGTRVPDDPFWTFYQEFHAINRQVVEHVDDWNVWQEDSLYDSLRVTEAYCEAEWHFYMDLQGDLAALDAPPDCRPIRDLYLDSLAERERFFDLFMQYLNTGNNAYREQANDALYQGNRAGLAALEAIDDLAAARSES